MREREREGEGERGGGTGKKKGRERSKPANLLTLKADCNAALSGALSWLYEPLATSL